MSEVVNYGWLKSPDDTKFAPKTFAQQVIVGDTTLDNIIDNCPILDTEDKEGTVNVPDYATRIEELEAENNELKSQLAEIGVVYEGTGSTTQVPSKTATELKSLTLPKGVYVICSSCVFTTSFTETTLIEVIGGNVGFTPTARGTGLNGGGLSISFIYEVTEETTLKMTVWQGSSSEVSASHTQFRAVRIK